MSKPRMSWKGTFLVVLAMMMGFAGWIFHRMETWPSRTAARVRQAFGEIAGLQPKITVNDHVFFEQSAPVLELAVITQDARVEREIVQESFGSKKRMMLRGVYTVRAGFDLTEPFTVTASGRSVVATVPPAKILSVEQKDVEVLAFENGLWNKIQPTEVAEEIKTMPQVARQQAEKRGLREEALSTFDQQLRGKLSPEYVVEVRQMKDQPTR